MSRVMHGRVRGRTIELHEDPGPLEGQEVEIQVTFVATRPQQPGQGLLRTEGALSDDPEWDGILDEILRSRKTERPSVTPELGEA